MPAVSTSFVQQRRGSFFNYLLWFIGPSLLINADPSVAMYVGNGLTALDVLIAIILALR